MPGVHALGDALRDTDAGVPPAVTSLWVPLDQAAWFVAEPDPHGVRVVAPKACPLAHRVVLLKYCGLLGHTC